MHLLITGSFAAVLTWANLYHFLLDLPASLAMQVVFGPTIHRRPNGWIGVVVIAESHVSVHTSGAMAYIDVFSCKEFDPDAALACISNFFALRDPEVHLIERLIAAKQTPLYPSLLAPAVAGVS